ncbi:MAG: M28 family peptidase [Desulfurococcales archaeon]|nr:M28 family peptidase [Desulfurococcales archaeon]
MTSDINISPWRFLEKIKPYVSKSRAYRILKLITLYHRIQGSPGLEEVAETIEEYILEEGPEIINTELFKYTGRQGPEWLPLPVSWNVHDARIIIGSKEYRLESHPTMAAAHSPPSDGWITGPVVKIQDPLNPDSYSNVSGKILLIEKHHRLAFRLASEHGASAVLLTMESRHHDSFPYIGLFLTDREALKYTIPALTIPWRIARNLEGKEVKLKLDSDIGGPGKLPVLVAWIGDRESPGPALIAHLCHPMPGANDNASGASSAIEAFLAIANAMEENVIDEPPTTIRLVLVPEYTGTILGMEGWMKNHVVEALNLDMVGASKSNGVEPPHAYYPPVSAPSNNLAETFIEAQTALRGQPRLKYYMYGSDHDVFLAYQRESIIINQWPDPYYHTDSDDADKIDPVNLWETALLASSTILARAHSYSPQSAPGAEIVVRYIMGSRLREEDELGYKLAGFYAPLRYGINPYTRPPTDLKLESDAKIKFKASRKLVLGPLSIVEESLDKAVELARFLEEQKLDTNMIYGELSFVAVREEPVSRSYIWFRSVYGQNITWEKYLETLTVLEDKGILELD